MQKLRFPIFILLLVFLFSYGSWQLPFIGPDEPRYSQIARQMLESGDFLTPHLGESVWFEKPVLLYWLIAVSFAVLGVSEFAARLPSLFSALGTVLLTFWLVTSATNLKRGSVAAMILATSAFFVGFSHAATFDMLFTFCITAGLFCFYSHELHPEKKRYLYAFYLACGLSVLAKGFAGMVLIGLTIFLYFLIQRRLQRIWDMKPVIGIAIVAAVTAIWFVPVSIVHGERFWNEFLLQHQVVRYTSSYYHRSGGLLFYIPILLLGTYPWTLAPFLLLRRNQSATDDRSARLRLLCCCWFFVTLLFFSLAQSKLPGYVLPAAPPFAVLAALALTDYFDKRAGNRKLILFLLLLNGSVCAALLWGAGRFGIHYASIIPLIVSLTAIVSLTIFLLKRNAIYAMFCYTLIPAAAMIFFLNDLASQFHWNDPKNLAERVQSHLSGSDKLVVYNVYDFASVFYTNARVELTPEGYLYNIRDYPSLHRYVRQHKKAFVIVANEELHWIREADFWRVAAVISGDQQSIVELHALR